MSTSCSGELKIQSTAFKKFFESKVYGCTHGTMDQLNDAQRKQCHDNSLLASGQWSLKLTTNYINTESFFWQRYAGFHSLNKCYTACTCSNLGVPKYNEVCIINIVNSDNSEFNLSFTIDELNS